MTVTQQASLVDAMSCSLTPPTDVPLSLSRVQSASDIYQPSETLHYSYFDNLN
ncbi:hypothetical protein J6590_011672 [Homalodisca vitripennis]|nr:hypothetical protein J6590_011672 [Homalodisca vitripennis]